MAIVDVHLAEAVEDAIQEAVSEAEQAALLAAIGNEDLPRNPEILLGAVFSAGENLRWFWEDLPDALAGWMHGTCDRDDLEERRARVKHMTRAACALIDAAIAETTG